ncbi:hypothetical protein MNV49_006547 [Pseudohyphozyma bogoriensis]|nr:hypothetical protein MNV49_006547 [Pseudohyphozyma bogoriensis]
MAASYEHSSAASESQRGEGGGHHVPGLGRWPGLLGKRSFGRDLRMAASEPPSDPLPPPTLPTPPSLRQLARDAASYASPRLVFSFGTNHPDAVFFATHTKYYSTPNTLPAHLKSLLDSGEIPLGTLRLVSLGPSDSFLAISANHAWWNLSCLDLRDQSALETLLRDLGRKERTGAGLEGIKQATFGARGEFVMLLGHGTEIFYSDHPPPNPLFEDRMKRLPPGTVISSCGLGPGGAYFVKLREEERPYWTPWTKWTMWPTEALEGEWKREGGLGILRTYASVMHHAYFFLVRTDGSRVDARYCLPPEAHATLDRWIAELTAQGSATFF